jgi:shikimate dehydrogenase
MRGAVLGSPIAHSLSPALHRAAYDALGLDWTYDAVECDVAALPGFLRACDDSWAGLSLTMPLKHAVVPLLDLTSTTVQLTGVANTVLFRDGTTAGDNTDVAGIAGALSDVGVDRVRSVTVFGGGATAASALAAARELGARDARLVVRSAERAAETVDVGNRVGLFVDVDAWPGDERAWRSELVVSSVPKGVADDIAVPTDFSGVLLDVVYDGWPTPLAKAAAATRATVVDGLAMLVHQAARQVELMTGRPAPLAAMQSAADAARATPS